MIAHLGLGSNVGDRATNLRAGLDGLTGAGVVVEAASSAYETEPVGVLTDQPDFLNAAARVRAEVAPEELLGLCKRIEAERGRRPDGPRHAPRPLDIDLLLVGDMEVRTARLTVPHPDLTTRRFVLVPLLELDPGLTLPDGTRLADALAALPPGQAVSRAGPLP